MMKHFARVFAFATALMFVGAVAAQGPARPGPTATPPQSCASLTSLALPHTTIDSAVVVDAGRFEPPAPPTSAGSGPNEEARRLYASLPSFCRVAATARPTTDSEIKIEVWLPERDAWNGKLQSVGNGGWAGVISYAALAAALRDGYATASTDTGHVGNTGAFALGHPQKYIDFGYRAVHEMTVAAKAIVSARFNSPATAAIWNGCSQGGRQGVTEAMRYPGDYDAIIAGAPSVNQTLLHAVRLYLNRIVHRSTDSYIPPERYGAIHAAVMRACDLDDGVKDGVIENPLRCRFDPKVLECKGNGADCLTPAQVETVKALFSPIVHPKTGTVLSPPLLQPGTELVWNVLAGPQPYNTAVELYKYVVFSNPDWDPKTFAAATDIDRALAADENVANLADPNLQPFFSRGGKLLLYHGWTDQQVPPQNTIRYFNSVVKTVGSDVVAKSIQLYLVPGMGHCRGGAGTDTFEKVAAMEEWMATGRAPESIMGSRLVGGNVVRTRPICAFGSVARWNGTGSSDDGAHFSCVVDRE